MNRENFINQRLQITFSCDFNNPLMAQSQKRLKLYDDQKKNIPFCASNWGLLPCPHNSFQLCPTSCISKDNRQLPRNNNTYRSALWPGLPDSRIFPFSGDFWLIIGKGRNLGIFLQKRGFFTIREIIDFCFYLQPHYNNL